MPSGKNSTRTYTITATSEAFDIVERFLVAMRVLGSWGASRELIVPVDGDGPVGLSIEELAEVTVERDVFHGAIGSHKPVRLGDAVPKLVKR